MKNLKIIYSANSDIVSDFEAIEWVDNKIQLYLCSHSVENEIRIGTEYMLNIFVLRVMQGIIPVENVEFYYEDIPLIFDTYDGIILPDNCPPFSWSTVVMEIVRLGYEKLNDKNCSVKQVESENVKTTSFSAICSNCPKIIIP